jgi:D-glucuronyl C5-epimerase C-terminus
MEAANSLESLVYALGALRREVLQFRFRYPLEIDLAAGPKESLHYYLYSEKLSWSIMSMDPTGVPRVRVRLAGTVYKPAYIAWWGLVNLGHYLRHHDSASRETFLRQVDWLQANATIRADGAVVWCNNYDWFDGKVPLKAPWISAYDQGLVISALVRGYRLTKRPQLLGLLRGASLIFAKGTHEGGVREPLPVGAVYSENPGQTLPGIQDGFMSSLLGLYDLFVETEDAAVRKMFDDGVAGLIAMLPAWDYRRRWSWYGSRAYLCPPAYHWLNQLLLEVLFRLSGQPALREYADAWKSDRLSFPARAEIFFMFLLTKNACRIRNRTWLLNQAKVRSLASRAASPIAGGKQAPSAGKAFQGNPRKSVWQ